MPESSIKTRTYELDGHGLENPIFEPHKRGKSWCAILTGKNAANMQRGFLRSRGPTIDLSSVEEGSVLEIAGDYVSSCGTPYPDRRYWRVVAIDEDAMTVEVHPSAAKALRAARVAVAASVAKG